MAGVKHDGNDLRARRLFFANCGKPEEVLGVEEFEPPEPAAGEVLVRIKAAPINPADLNLIEGTYGVKAELPAVPGIEGCGVVVSGGSGRFEAGRRVMFLRRASTWASHVIVPEDVLFALPDGIDMRQAAMMKVNPATAWRLLHGFAELKPGDWVVQNAGNSAVGRCVIQLARECGVRTVSLVRRADLVDELRELGGDVVLPDGDAAVAEALEHLGGATARSAFNAVGGESALRLMKLLEEGGTHITYGAMSRKPLTLPNGLLIFRDIRLRGLWVTKWLEHAPCEEVRATYEKLAELVNAGRLLQKVDSVFSLEEWPTALLRLKDADRNGKVLLVP
jgi:NADPH:quinone reductase-like Zn-dependent oxidoreductase